jgi:ATP-dependent Lon protease
MLGSILQLFDPIQNHTFKDNYVGDISINISHLWFVCSMNKKPEQQALKDRIFFIEIQPYSKYEQCDIILNHSLEKICDKYNTQFDMNRNVCEIFIDKCNLFESNNNSMRPIIHNLDNLCSQLKFQNQHPNIKMSFCYNIKINDDDKIVIDDNVVQEYFRRQQTKSNDVWKNIYI